MYVLTRELAVRHLTKQGVLMSTLLYYTSERVKWSTK